MKKINSYASMICLLSLSLGNSAWSQGPAGHGPGGPGGPGGPHNGGAWNGPSGQHFGGQDPGVPRMGQPVFSTGCGQQYALPAQSALLSACVAGGAAAMQTAQRLASQQGRNDGFRTGYAWGVRQGIDRNSGNPVQITAGQNLMNTQDSPQLFVDLGQADQAGGNAGTSQGSANGDQEAVARFHGAIDTGTMPSQALSDSDYYKYNPQYSSNYGNPYAQTVGPIKSELDILNGGQIDPGQCQFYGNGYDSGIFGGAPSFRPGDFYAPNGNYGFNRGQELDAGNAFNRFINHGFDHGDYDHLGSVAIITGYTNPAPTAPVAPAPAPAPAPVSGNPGGGGHGGPGPGQGPVTARPVGPAPVGPAPVVPAPVAPAAPQPIYTTYNLKQIYQDAFIHSYSQVAGFYYNNAYNDILDEGTNAGYYVGQQVGSRLALQTGIENAYNAQFRVRENNAFRFGSASTLGYNKAFASQFTTEYRNYATNPIIGVDAFTIAGVRNDGIIQPGEGITASYVIRNYGGVSATLPVVLQGDVTGAVPASLVVQALTTSRQAGKLTASISASVASQSEANIVLNVNGSKIVQQDYVTNQVVPGAVSYTTDMAHGVVMITLPLQNVSTANSYDALTMVVSDSYNRSETLQLGFLAGGQTYSVPVNLNGYNPIDLISGKISVKMQANLGSIVVGSASQQIVSANPSEDIAATFEVVAAGSNTGLQSQVSAYIFNAVKTEALADSNQHSDTYAKDASTVIAALLNLKKSHAQSSASLAAYKSLATTLNPVLSAIHSQHGGFFGSGTANETFFKNALKTLSSN